MLPIKPGAAIHLVGVGGISMSGLARLFLERGYRVSGSDLKVSPLVEALVRDGLRFYRGHAADHVDGADLVVYTAAVKADNPELLAAEGRAIPCWSRAELIGRLMEDATNGIAVAGTHGKTTTTALIGAILLAAGRDPTALVGGEALDLGGNVRVGHGPDLVTEACEFADSFLRFRPSVGVLLNIDDDHLDYFSSIDRVTEAFARFARLVPPAGWVVANADDPRVRAIVTGDSRVVAQVRTFGRAPEAAWRAEAAGYQPGTGQPTFTLVADGRNAGPFKLQLVGMHHVGNALAALAAADAVGVPPEQARPVLEAFSGVRRRFEYRGTADGARVYDDYAHHPAAIRVTLEGARAFAPRRLGVVFQPHLFSRTRALLEGFAEALAAADRVWVLDIYPSREKDPGDIHARDLVAAIERHAPGRAVYTPTMEAAADAVAGEARSDDLILTCGAGDVDRVADLLCGPRTEPGHPPEVGPAGASRKNGAIGSEVAPARRQARNA